MNIYEYILNQIKKLTLESRKTSIELRSCLQMPLSEFLQAPGFSEDGYFIMMPHFEIIITNSFSYRNFQYLKYTSLVEMCTFLAKYDKGANKSPYFRRGSSKTIHPLSFLKL